MIKHIQNYSYTPINDTITKKLLNGHVLGCTPNFLSHVYEHGDSKWAWVKEYAHQYSGFESCTISSSNSKYLGLSGLEIGRH